MLRGLAATSSTQKEPCRLGVPSNMNSFSLLRNSSLRSNSFAKRCKLTLTWPVHLETGCWEPQMQGHPPGHTDPSRHATEHKDKVSVGARVFVSFRRSFSMDKQLKRDWSHCHPSSSLFNCLSSAIGTEIGI